MILSIKEQQARSVYIENGREREKDPFKTQCALMENIQISFETKNEENFSFLLPNAIKDQ